MSLPARGRRAQGQEEGGLNLVPYIDLLTCMVSFLLITAVWTQVARLQVAQHGHGDGDGDDLPGLKLTVLVGADGFNLLVGGDRQIFPRRAERYDYAALATALQRVKREHPDKNDALVASEDQIAFDTIVGTMDTVLSSGFPAVSLVEAGAAR
jgi:biopolymer transport protein TolR